jgi:glucokinase
MLQNRPEEITTELLAEAANQGDETALEVWGEAGRRLGTAMASLVNILNPECFIIGGGVAKAGDVLFDPIREAVESLAMNKLGRSTAIMGAGLGAEAGIIGAATFAMLCNESEGRYSIR